MAYAADRNGSHVASRTTATTVTTSTRTNTGNGQILRTATGAVAAAMSTGSSHGTGTGAVEAAAEGGVAVEPVSSSAAAYKNTNAQSRAMCWRRLSRRARIGWSSSGSTSVPARTSRP